LSKKEKKKKKKHSKLLEMNSEKTIKNPIVASCRL